MDRAYHVSRILFGLWFTYAGVEYFLPQFFTQPLGDMKPAHDFTVALIDSGIFVWVKVLELVIGVCVLANRWVLAAGLACLPLTVVITWWNVVLEGTALPLAFGVLTPALNLAILWPFRRLIWPLLLANPAREY